jgi:hypothetical protein
MVRLNNMKSIVKHFVTGMFAAAIVYSGNASYGQTTPQLVSSSSADTWVATDGIGRKVEPGETGLRKDKFVGMFYFIWLGAHGYDKHSGGAADEGIMKKTDADTLSPYNITEMLLKNPANPQYGPLHAFHHWAEPFFGYYLSNDEWVIRKHGQMLADAGVDVLILDVTNAAIYLPQVTKIAETFRAMRKEGETTPSISFIVNSVPGQTVKRLYDDIYSKKLFKDLWFYWKGKPLLLCPPEGLTEETKSFFSSRHSWAWSKGQEWFGDGKDKWPWLDHTPQSYGWHESKDKPEQVSVAVAEHPMSNIGRSFHNGKQPTEFRSGEGLYFDEQWKRVMEVDPEFVFLTGWNEWAAMRFNDGKATEFLGKSIKKGETYFVDNYNGEFSRDAEPVKGMFNDNYYYQLVYNIRKYKGARLIPVFKKTNNIAIDGNFCDWKNVEAIYTDDKGDTFHRKHPGWGRIKEYVNTTGRNDIIESRVTSDAKNIYFYVKTAAPLTEWQSKDWMKLFISVKDSRKPDWEGFHYVVNGQPSETTTTIASFKGGWNLNRPRIIDYRKGANEIELAVPKTMLGIKGNAFTLDFKWADNFPAGANPIAWLDLGDAAPNARFNYRYIKE